MTAVFLFGYLGYVPSCLFCILHICFGDSFCFSCKVGPGTPQFASLAPVSCLLGCGAVGLTPGGGGGCRPCAHTCRMESPERLSETCCQASPSEPESTCSESGGRTGSSQAKGDILTGGYSSLPPRRELRQRAGQAAQAWGPGLITHC